MHIYLKIKKNVNWILLSFILLTGLVIRIIDLDDLPLDFHPTRQLHSAILARGIYAAYALNYDPDFKETDIRISQTIYQYEPPILESIVAFFYLIFGEYLWIARLINIIIWIGGGIIVYNISTLLVDDSLTNKISALFGPAIYSFLPYGIIGSRSFQPDPLMVLLVISTLYCCLSLQKKTHWNWYLLTGTLGAMSILVKGFAIFFIAPLFLITILTTTNPLKFKFLIKNPKIWSLVLIPAIPIIYYIWGSTLNESNYIQNWFFSLIKLLITPRFYMVWIKFLQTTFSFWLLFGSLLGCFIAKKNLRLILIALWVGYFIYCFFVPHQTMTHDYYHLIVIPLVAISTTPIINLVYIRLLELSWLQKTITGLFIILIILTQLWGAGSDMLQTNYRQEKFYWQEVARELPENTSIIALTQHYGYPLAYWGRRSVRLWPNSGELYLADIRGNNSKEFEEQFQQRTSGADIFLITDLSDFNQQKDLSTYLFDNYALIFESPRVLIFSLDTNY